MKGLKTSNITGAIVTLRQIVMRTKNDFQIDARCTTLSANQSAASERIRENLPEACSIQSLVRSPLNIYSIFYYRKESCSSKIGQKFWPEILNEHNFSSNKIIGKQIIS